LKNSEKVKINREIIAKNIDKTPYYIVLLYKYIRLAGILSVACKYLTELLI